MAKEEGIMEFRGKILKALPNIFGCIEDLRIDRKGKKAFTLIGRKEKRKELEKEIRKFSFKLKRGEKNPSSFSSKKVYFTLTIKSSEWFLISVFASANSDS